MDGKKFTYVYVVLTILMLGLLASCQKDNDVKDPAEKTSLSADSSILAAPGNFLASSGTLTIKYNDTTYTFDAAHDSIAFINVHNVGDNQFFGITAINKAHSMSFGVSSQGFANSNTNQAIAGSQFLLTKDEKSPALQLSLSKYSGENFGSLTLDDYKHGNVLAKGSFTTFLAKDDKANSPYYKIEGSFNLQLK